MVNLQTIEQALVVALKARNQLEADTLRALKTRLQNEKISLGKELDEQQVIQLVQSEVKRRKDATEMYINAGRQELAEKEKSEIVFLQKFLPEQVSEEDIAKIITELISEHSFTKVDFGKAMGQLKARFGNTADGATLSKILKEKLG